MAKTADIYFTVDPWRIIEEGFSAAHARESESVFSLANEYQGIRGCFDEGGGDSLRGAYVNGVYDIELVPKSYKGIIASTHFMIPAADWIKTDISLDGEKLDLRFVRFKDFRRVLDMREGTLTRSFTWLGASGKTLRLTFTRFLDMEHRERAWQRIEMEALNFTGTVRITSGLSFGMRHEGRQKCFWHSVRADARQGMMALQARTTASGQEVFAGAAVSLDGAVMPRAEGLNASLSTDIVLEKGRSRHFDKRVVILFNGDSGESLWTEGLRALDAAMAISPEAALDRQRAYWARCWRTSDILIEAADGPDRVSAAAEQQGIRFCIFQLTQTYNGGSMKHNIGAKGLTGEAYNGHAFWDTESCCLPFYLFTNPAAARDLLLFRCNTLPQALERARELDLKGACYPVATLNGGEACPLWQHANLQMQPGTAVAYGIWHYVRLTGDRDFLWDWGARMLLEIARYLRSRAGRDPVTGQWGFFGVMGPDEFHMMVSNNAYTNYMGKRTLLYAADTLEAMQHEQGEKYAALCEAAGYQPQEALAWRTIANDMYIPSGGEGLIEQHDGFFHLPHTDIASIPVSEFPLYEHWSYDRIYRTDMIKQPDVLMMLYLYNTSFTRETKRLNYEYYQPRTIHESSLSPAIHSILAAELGKMDDAMAFFGFATRLDLDNYNRNTREGLHITSIAMAWANIVYGFGGLRSDGDTLRFAPRLPKRWQHLAFSIRYRGRVIHVSMKKGCTVLCLTEGEDLTVLIDDVPCTLTASETVVPRQGFKEETP